MSHPEHTQAPFTWKDRTLVAYLQERTGRGERYFKSRHVADDLSLSPQEVGAAMVKLRSRVPSLHIEKWSTTSPVTWRVAPVSPEPVAHSSNGDAAPSG